MERPLVVIGTSLGGLTALEALLSGLSKTFPWAVAIVQHRGTEAVGDAFVEALQRRCPLPVAEVEDKDLITPGRVYLGPADYHLLVEADSFALSTEAKVHYARPSIDVLFDSAAAACGAALVGVILTGASADGALGAARVKAVGGVLLVQDPDTAECPVMPRAAIAAATPDRVLTLGEVAGALNQLTASRR